MLAFALALIMLTFAVLLLAVWWLAVAGLLLAITFSLHALTLALLRLLLLALLLAAHLVLITTILGLLAIPFAALLILHALLLALLLIAVALHLALPLFAIAHVLGALTFQFTLALPLTALTLAPGPVIAVLTLIDRVGGISGLRAVNGGGAIAATVTTAIAGVELAGNRAGSAQHRQPPHAGPAYGGGHQGLQDWFHGLSGEVWWAQCLVLLTFGGCSGLTSLGCLLIQ